MSSKNKERTLWDKFRSIFHSGKKDDTGVNHEQNSFDNLLNKQRSIIHYLHALIREADPDTAIQNILNEILNFLDVDHVCIIEYDMENKVTNCTYEALKKGIPSIKETCRALPIDEFSWWTEQIIKDIPIIASRIEDISSKAALAKQKMIEQGVKSVMIVPFISKNEGLGYICADTIRQYREWSKDDYQWFFSFSNVLSIYIELRRREISRLKAESKIYDFEQIFKLIANHAKVGYAQYNVATGQGYASDSWYHNVGEKPGKSLRDVVRNKTYLAPEDKERMDAYTQQVLAGEADALRTNVRFIREDGKVIWSCFNCVVRNQNPKKDEIEILSINYDITELKEMEQKLIEACNKAETSDQLKSAFLANVSHEIRTPLNSIVGFSDLLVDCDNAEERQQYATIIRKNNNNLLKIISDILDTSKIESGTFTFNYKMVETKHLCTEIIQSYQMVTEAKVLPQLEEGLQEYHVQCDKARITQVISNFINNAIKFTEKGSIILGYRQISEHELKFYVRDTGIGIPANKINIIFERFMKLNRHSQGTGLGLSICKSIVEQAGGKIGVDSKVGEGSCFWFTHPM